MGEPQQLNLNPDPQMGIITGAPQMPILSQDYMNGMPMSYPAPRRPVRGTGFYIPRGRGMYMRGNVFFGPRVPPRPPGFFGPWMRQPRPMHYPVDVSGFPQVPNKPWAMAKKRKIIGDIKKDNDEKDENKLNILNQNGAVSNGKKKKKLTGSITRPWSREAAEKAIAMEQECQNSAMNAIVVRFPDPELSKDIVQSFHCDIENVHFQSPCGPRYCFVTLKPDADIEKTIREINKIKFGVGKLRAERKVQKSDEKIVTEDIDPFTLYIGNLPMHISTAEVKEKFPTSTRVDVGYAKKMKFTRYAFARYATAEAALEAYKDNFNSVIATRSIILRFRRRTAPVGPPGEKPAAGLIEPKPGEKLTVGAKLKAKQEKVKKEQREKLLNKDEESEDEIVEFEDDDDPDKDDTTDDDDDDDSLDDDPDNPDETDSIVNEEEDDEDVDDYCNNLGISETIDEDNDDDPEIQMNTEEFEYEYDDISC